MILRNNNEIRNKIEKLQQLLSDNSLTLPLFVRFRTTELNLIISIRKIISDSDSIKLYNTDTETPAYCLGWNDIINIEALCDTKRKPFFLNDFNEEGETSLAEEIYPNRHN